MKLASIATSILFLVTALPSSVFGASLEIGGSLLSQKGNSSLEKYSVSFEGVVGESFVSLAKLGLSYDFSRTEAGTETDKGSQFLEVEYGLSKLGESLGTKIIPKPLYVYARAETGHDNPAGLDEIMHGIAGLGLGAKWLEGKWEASARFGGGLRAEGVVNAEPRALKIYSGQIKNVFDIDGIKLTSTSKITSENTFGLSLTKGNRTFNQETVLSIPGIKNLKIDIAHKYNHRTNPLAGAGKVDREWKISLKFKVSN